ncbi:jg25567 [Pararge aegeria aegeria]|uniref:Jg25567 protein n=1 Tax=Pararge aegeria aegeria TaxID=348720 RepID=A0A8S4RUI2_9NEOP|nr:jg25567 [Pararge aegeria aegeria]
MERERRALSVRGNMLARRFARCTTQVKVTLFRAYCQSFYTCNLWTNYTQRAYSALRIQYNNVLRAVLRKPRHCSALAMFANALQCLIVHVDDFFAIMRRRAASMLCRLVSSTNTLLNTWANKLDSPLWRCWNGAHTGYRRAKPRAWFVGPV